LNHVYPEESLDAPSGYKCTILINQIRNPCKRLDILKANLDCLLQFKARIDIADSDGVDVIMHSIKQNDHDLVSYFLSNAQTMPVREFLRHNQDSQGKNAIHCVVNPFKFGSFENKDILRSLLVSHIGYDAQHKDKQGMTP